MAKNKVVNAARVNAIRTRNGIVKVTSDMLRDFSTGAISTKEVNVLLRAVDKKLRTFGPPFRRKRTKLWPIA